MTSHIVWQGFAVGFLAAIPSGPMGMLCVQRTLQHGRLSGLASAGGLTLAAAFWCSVAALGLSNVTRLVAGHEPAFTVALGLFLVVAGVLGLIHGGGRTRPVATGSYGGLASQFFSSMLGVLLNPITFVTMSAVLAILGGVKANLGIQGVTGLAGGVLVGGMTVWVCIIHGVILMKQRLGEGGGLRLSRALNCCILFLGLIYLVEPFLQNVRS